MSIREAMKPYIIGLMKEAHEKGTPVIRPLFYDFPEDMVAWEISHQYMFGSEILVAPILYEGIRSRKVYLPTGAEWKDANSGQINNGGQWINYDAPLEIIPLFIKNQANINIFG